MNEPAQLTVTMPREHWLAVYALLRPADGVSPASDRLRAAIETAMDVSIDAALERINQAEEVQLWHRP